MKKFLMICVLLNVVPLLESGAQYTRTVSAEDIENDIDCIFETGLAWSFLINHELSAVWHKVVAYVENNIKHSDMNLQACLDLYQKYVNLFSHRYPAGKIVLKNQRLEKSILGKNAPLKSFVSHCINNTTIYLSFPTIYEENMAHEYQCFLEQIKIDIQKKCCIVIDLRGPEQEGDFSDFSSQVLKTIYGKDYDLYRYCKSAKQVIEEIEKLQDRFAQFLKNHASHFLKKMEQRAIPQVNKEGMIHLYNTQIPFLKSNLDKAIEDKNDIIIRVHEKNKNPIILKKNHLIILVDKTSSDFAIDFTNQIKSSWRLPVTIVGEGVLRQLDSGSIYFDLPSNIAQWVWPVAEVNPDYYYKDDAHDYETFKQWFLEHFKTSNNGFVYKGVSTLF